MVSALTPPRSRGPPSRWWPRSQEYPRAYSSLCCGRLLLRPLFQLCQRRFAPQQLLHRLRHLRVLVGQPRFLQRPDSLALLSHRALCCLDLLRRGWRRVGDANTPRAAVRLRPHAEHDPLAHDLAARHGRGVHLVIALLPADHCGGLHCPDGRILRDDGAGAGSHRAGVALQHALLLRVRQLVQREDVARRGVHHFLPRLAQQLQPRRVDVHDFRVGAQPAVAGDHHKGREVQLLGGRVDLHVLHQRPAHVSSERLHHQQVLHDDVDVLKGLLRLNHVHQATGALLLAAALLAALLSALLRSLHQQ
mmetsp:Transcript_33903/g.87968  ORF Transcript_33903/g.87968 Transcript_33903/m.87968 type:complete len:306 (-) Transcript_33903:587-1504(-)